MAATAVALDAPRFPDLVEEAMSAMWPAAIPTAAPGLPPDMVGSISAGFEELEEVSAEHERYDLGWAFKQARQRFGGYYESAAERFEQSMSEERSGDPVHTAGERSLRALAWSSRVFPVLSTLVSVVDIVISVVLILVISKISHYTDSMIGSTVVALVVVGLVALFKVTLDRFVIIPFVHRWGWRRFAGALQRNKRILSNLLAVNLVVREVTAQGHTDQLDTVRNCCLGRLRTCFRKQS